jgi:hypothetical protein
MKAVNPFPADGYEFGLCLTHDVDRPYKGVQALYHALADREPSHLSALVPGRNPWWQFETVMDLESSLGVRSAFYFLSEPHLLQRDRENWIDPYYVVEHFGRYDPRESAIAAVIRDLHEGGWEVGIHGSLGTARDASRLALERDRIESVLGDTIEGGRQHHLDHEVPETWHHYESLGLVYDSSLGSATRVGFEHGYDLLCPFDDEFVVFPLTVMDKALDNCTAGEDEAWAECERLLDEAAENGAVMTVLWHLRNFCERDYPGHQRLYRKLIERARELGGWVGPPAHLYEQFDLAAATEPVEARQ